MFGAIGALWASGTQWLTHRTSTGDATKSRWPVSAYWQVIQRASLVASAIPLERVRAIRHDAMFERIAQGLGGYLVSLAVLERVSTLETVLPFVPVAVRHWENISHQSFRERLERRIRERRFQ